MSVRFCGKLRLQSTKCGVWRFGGETDFSALPTFHLSTTFCDSHWWISSPLCRNPAAPGGGHVLCTCLIPWFPCEQSSVYALPHCRKTEPYWSRMTWLTMSRSIYRAINSTMNSLLAAESLVADLFQDVEFCDSGPCQCRLCLRQKTALYYSSSI